MPRVSISALLILVCMVLAACEQGENRSPGRQAPEINAISGTVSYRERIALSDRAVLEIILQDVTITDTTARVIAKHRITHPGQVPIHFRLEYPKEDIDERRKYSLELKISDGGRLMFTNDAQVPVLTRGAGKEVNVSLVRVRMPAPDENPTTEESSGMDLEGMFQYMADAALFRDCRTNLLFPVSMEARYIELENAYLTSGIEAGEEMYVRLTGRYLERMNEDGNSNIIKLIVDNLNNYSADKVCAPSVHADLENTYWKLTELQGLRVSTPEGMREAHLILSSEDSRAQGFASCNGFFGSYQAEGNALSFTDLGLTMMTCPSGMETEQLFLQALGEATRAEVEGLLMNLYAGDRLLASFEAVYL